jgi:hypothetical protein
VTAAELYNRAMISKQDLQAEHAGGLTQLSLGLGLAWLGLARLGLACPAGGARRWA